jgi:hypothetical protein
LKQTVLLEQKQSKQPNIEMDHLFSFLLSFIFFFLYRELRRESSDENGAVVRKKAPVIEIFALETFQHEQGKMLEIRLLGRFLLLLDDLRKLLKIRLFGSLLVLYDVLRKLFEIRLFFKEWLLPFMHECAVTAQTGRMRERFLTVKTAQHLSTKANLTMTLK